MKKILLASTALVATAGMAAAEITFSGSGRFGLSYVEDRGTVTTTTTVTSFTGGTTTTTTTSGAVVVTGTGDVVQTRTQSMDELDDTILYSRMRVNIDASTATDGGIEFGGRIRIQAVSNSEGEAADTGISGAQFSVAYGGLEVYVGNVGSAVDQMKHRAGVAEPGSLFNFGQAAAMNYDKYGFSSGGNGNHALYATYSTGPVLLGLSYDDNSGEDQTEAFITYTGDTFGVTLAGGEAANGDEVVLLAGQVSLGDLSLGAVVGDEDLATNDATLGGTFYGISAAYAVSSATTIEFAYGRGSESTDAESYGIGVAHSLGGNVTVVGGVGENNDATEASVGVRLGF